MTRSFFLKSGLIVLCFLSTISTANANSIVTQWNDIILESIHRDSSTKLFAPTIYARSLAIVSTCMYDAWSTYDQKAKPSLPNNLPKQVGSELDKEKAVSFAAYQCLVDQYPDQIGFFNNFMAELGYDLNDATLPAKIGKQAAVVVIVYRHNDGSNQLGDLHPGEYSDYTNYQPVNTADRLLDPNRWQPITFPDGQGGTFVPGFITPHWRLVKPFALTSSNQFQPPPPSFYPAFGYTQQSRDLVKINSELTDRDKMISEYWAEEKPGSITAAGTWDVFAKFISIKNQYNLENDIKLFFILNNALLDSSIAAWDAKVRYDYVRPISAIRFLYKDKMIRAWGGPCKGTMNIAGERWLPYRTPQIPTPPFAEYVSGHATFGGAAAEVLKLFTNSDNFGFSVTLPRGSSEIEGRKICPDNPLPVRDVTLRWNTFTEAANENSQSRLFGGVHFDQAATEGVSLGRKVGNEAWKKAQDLFQGK